MMDDVVVFTQAWSHDHPREGAEDPSAQLGSRILVDGEELRYVTGITVRTKGGDFLEADLHITPSSIRFVSLDKDDWKLDDITGLA